MRNYCIGVIVLLTLVTLSGCGGGSSNPSQAQSSADTTFYLQTYDDGVGRYEGVEDLYYECGDAHVGYTGANGLFRFKEGEECRFYDLNRRRSYEFDRLYISGTPDGSYAVSEVPYRCASGWNGVSDTRGMFIFDPDYQSSKSDGDLCVFSF